MIDTIKLLIPVDDPLILNGERFTPTLRELVSSSKYGKATLNPQKTEGYMPRLTMFKRPSKYGAKYQLAVEFSAPKMLFGNNFDELIEEDFDQLLSALQEKLHLMIGIRFFKEQLAKADVGSLHPSKNIVFLDYTSCQTILDTIGKADVSKVYDLQKTDFRQGHVVHIHSNSLDIAFYDKIADLKKAKRSEKRAIEKDNSIQMSLFDGLKSASPIEVLRYEVRLVGRSSVKRAYPELESWTLESLFKKKLCRGVLVKHWQKISSSLDMLSLDVREPYELTQNYLIENPGVRPQTALAAVAALLVTKQKGSRELRDLLESRFGVQAWYRIKSILKSPGAYRYQYFVHIDEALEAFSPVRLSKFIE